MDWQFLIHDGIIIFALGGLILILKKQISSMKETMDAFKMRSDEFEKLIEKYKQFSDDIEEKANQHIRLAEEIFKKEKRIIEIEKSEAIGEQAKEIADLKFKKLGLELELTLARIQADFISKGTWQSLLANLGFTGLEHLTAGSMLSMAHGSKIELDSDSAESEDEKKE